MEEKINLLEDIVLYFIGLKGEYIVQSSTYKYHIEYYSILFQICDELMLEEEPIYLERNCMEEIVKRGYVLFESSLIQLRECKEYGNRKKSGTLMLPETLSDYQKECINKRIEDFDKIYMNIFKYNSGRFDEIPTTINGEYNGSKVLKNFLIEENKKKIYRKESLK